VKWNERNKENRNVMKKAKVENREQKGKKGEQKK
jgi:hypothetical protein